MKSPPKHSRIRTSTDGKWLLKATQQRAVTQVRTQARPPIPPRDASHDAAREAARRLADKYCTRDGRQLFSVASRTDNVK
jgi:hypothetical protein